MGDGLVRPSVPVPRFLSITTSRIPASTVIRQIWIISMPSDLTYLCPVCGFTALTEPPYDDFGCPTYVICPCCGTEFGYDDSTATHQVLREKWVSLGMHWWNNRQQPPEGWDADAQLRAAQLNP